MRLIERMFVKAVAKTAFEAGVSPRSPEHLLAFVKNDPRFIDIDLQFRVDLFYGIAHEVRNLEAMALGYLSEAHRFYALARGEGVKVGEAVSIYV